MKYRQGFQAVGVVIGVVVALLLVFATCMVVNANNNAVNYDNYDFNSIIEPDKYNGEIGDHVKGDKDAPVIVIEYADFQCPGCASMNTRINKIIDELDGKLAVVYRNHLLSYHKNGTAAASAAEAAGLQGYWKAYADKLFANQAEWEYATSSERTSLFEKYFTEVSKNEGDLEKFRQDVASDAVSQKISFDMGIGRRIDIPATPSFFIDGQRIELSGPGELDINGKIISWDAARTNDDITQLFKDIVEAKTK